MRLLDIVKPVCKGLMCGAALAVLSKPFKLSVRVGKATFSVGVQKEKAPSN